MRLSLSGFSIPFPHTDILSPALSLFHPLPIIGTPPSPPLLLPPPRDAANESTRAKRPSSRDQTRSESSRSPAPARPVRSVCRPAPPPAQSRKPYRRENLHPPVADPPP